MDVNCFVYRPKWFGALKLEAVSQAWMVENVGRQDSECVLGVMSERQRKAKRYGFILSAHTVYLHQVSDYTIKSELVRVGRSEEEASRRSIVAAW